MKRIAAIALAALALLIVLAAIAWWVGETWLTPSPAASPSPQTPGATTSVSAIKLYVAQDGLYRVPLSDLEAAGLAGAAARASDLALTWHDQSIPRAIDGDALVFYGQANRSPYAAESAYWVALTGEAVAPAQRESAPDNAPSGAPPRTVYTATLRLKQEQVYYARAPQDNARWFWVSLTAPRAYTITFALDERAAGPSRLRVALLGSTQAPVQPDHHVQLVLNGQSVADDQWDGATPHEIDVLVPADTWRDGENTLAVRLPGDTGAPADIVLLDRVEVAYPRRLAAVADRLSFATPPGTYQPAGFGAPLVVYDVTDPLAPVQLTGLTPAFTTALTGTRDYAAAGPDGWLRPARVVAAAGSSLRDPATQADWMLVAPADLLPALQPLADWRREQGLATLMVDIQAVYDAFSYGEATPQALKDWLTYAYTNWAQPAPRFVVLAGTASYDYRDVLDAPHKNLVPTYLLHSSYVGETGSDNWFADVADDDGRPELALGRLSVGTVEEARALAQRLVAYERDTASGDWQCRVLFVADGKEPQFRSMAEELAASPALTGTNVVRVYQGDLASPEAAREHLLAEWDQGALLMTYLGHAGINVWTDKQLFRMDDVAALRNGDRRPFIATMTCLDGYYHHPQAQCLAEALLLAPQGGAIAVLAPTSESLPTDQSFLIRGLLEALSQRPHPTVGEAVLQAKRGLPDTAAARDLMATFNLLGDPATRLPFPVSCP